MSEMRDSLILFAVGTVTLVQTGCVTARSLQTECDNGWKGACFDLALKYAAGQGVQKDDAMAVQLFQKGCNDGMSGLCGADGVQFLCDHGILQGCFSLGMRYLIGHEWDVRKDDAKAVQLFQTACDGGEERSCTQLGLMNADGTGVQRDGAKAFHLFQKACDGGEPKGCSELGVMYETGRAVRKDRPRAFHLYQQACRNGMAIGCKYPNAFQLYQKACRGDMEIGCFYFVYGPEGVRIDDAEAVQRFQKACEGGVEKGCYHLGARYAAGEGVPKDYVRAVQLFRKTCDAGDKDGCVNLGAMYSKGSGVQRDDAKAAEFFQKAHQLSD
jgi:uncharacterized protein